MTVQHVEERHLHIHMNRNPLACAGAHNRKQVTAGAAAVPLEGGRAHPCSQLLRLSPAPACTIATANHASNVVLRRIAQSAAKQTLTGLRAGENLRHRRWREARSRGAGDEGRVLPATLAGRAAPIPSAARGIALRAARPSTRPRLDGCSAGQWLHDALCAHTSAGEVAAGVTVLAAPISRRCWYINFMLSKYVSRIVKC